jgi:hypothetical protein
MPSGIVIGFLQVAQAGNYKAAADYLQISAARRGRRLPLLHSPSPARRDR